MSQITDNLDVSNFTRLARLSPAHAVGWLDRLRKRGIETFGQLGWPTTREEEWRLTSVAPIARTNFIAGRYEGNELTRKVLAPHSIADEAAAELVFVNGFFAPELSRIESLPEGVLVTTLECEAGYNDGQFLQEHLSRYADLEHNPFVALNTGFVRDGAVIHIRRGVMLELPIHVLFVSTPGEVPIASHPRLLVIADDNAFGSIVESYTGIGEGVYFTNAVTEIALAPGARIDHCKVQHEGLEAFHVATLQVKQARSSNFISHNATIGASLTRNDINVTLDGEGSEATLNGLTLIEGHQHVDNHLFLDHATPNTASHELYKSILGESATGVFKGKILVRQAAQKTDAKQTSQTLLLSDDAIMNSQPALEIYADDVKCTHGSTIGPLDDQQIFYLRSRGVPLDAARHLLTYAFAADITSRIKIEPVRRRLEEYMAAQHGLPKDLRITKAIAHDEPVRK
jgi:Fe-S cluster assembly protein SufD